MDGKILERSEIEEKYKWQLEDMYANNDLWEADLEKTFNLAKELSSFKGTLSGSGRNLFDCLSFSDRLDDKSLAVYAYARMRRDEDNNNATYQDMADRATRLLTESAAAASFIAPEIVSMGCAKLDQFIAEKPELSVYEHLFCDILREREHTLSEREEELLALSYGMAESASDIYDMFNDADLRFGEIQSADGQLVELTQGRYSAFLESRDRFVRKAAFDAMYAQYKKYQNTLSAMLGANVKKNCFYANVRKYASAMEMCLSQDNISCDVYENLISVMNRYIPELHRYLRLRKKALRLDELHMYDLYTPMVAIEDTKYTYEQACDMVLHAVAPLGERYVSDMKKALGSRWVDVYENRGKTSGAYSWGSNQTHPFVLLNFQGTIGDVFTLAHEMGHAMHSYYTNSTQPTVYKRYKIFVAEVASTVNENLLMEYLLATTKDHKLRTYLFNHRLEEFRTTVFRQTMFAEFERDIHAMYEKGESLTAESLCNRYYQLNEKYYAPCVTVDEEIAYEWARIPHFYADFYVYQYATGYSAAVALATGIIKDKAAANRYLEFLKGGNSKYPLDLLRDAGVDLSRPEPIEHALDSFIKIIDELEKNMGNAN